MQLEIDQAQFGLPPHQNVPSWAGTMTNSLRTVNEHPIAERGTILIMGERPADWLKKARRAAGYLTATEAARAMGVRVPTYLGHENGSTEFPHVAAKYAAFFHVSVDYLLTGKGGSGRIQTKIPVISFIGAGAELFPVDDHAKGQGLELVDPPPGVTDCVAARIRGESMHPMRDGWLIFWKRDQDGIPEECIGELCVVQVRNGPTLLKDLYRSAKKGRFNLVSWNAPTREDVQVEWAARVIDIRPM